MPKLNKNISLFGNVKEKTPRTVKFSYFMDGHRWKAQVDHVRAAPTKAERKQRKLELPAATLSGVFSSRGSEYLVEHSGLLCLDIDRQDNPHIENFTDLKYQIGNINNVAYARASVAEVSILERSVPDRLKEQKRNLSPRSQIL